MTKNQTFFKKHMVFGSGQELFACPLSHVKEVVGFHKMTLVPTAPKSLRGLINLRGKVLPVFDFAEKANCPLENRDSLRPCILIAELKGSTLGLLVDNVVEVISIHEEQIERQEQNADRKIGAFEGVLKIEGKPLILLVSFEKLFEGENVPSYTNEKAALNQAA